MSMPFLSVLYDEPDPSTYRGVCLQMGERRTPEVFNTGDPTVDYTTAMIIIMRRYEAAGVDLDNVWIGGSSSIDHFVMDGGALETGNPTDDQVQAAVSAAKSYLIEQQGSTEEA